MFIFSNRAFRTYLITSVVLAAFSAVYECFSHDVISLYMSLAFLWPLLAGALPAFFAARLKWHFPAVVKCLHAAAVSTLALACVLTGVFEIYGSTNEYVPYFWALGALDMLAALVTAWLKRRS